MGKPNPYKENVIFGVRHGRKMSKKDLDAYYWSWLEFGHLVRPKGKGRGKAARAFAEQSGVKKVKAYPFIVPAFKNKMKAAMERIKEVLIKKIKTLVKEK